MNDRLETIVDTLGPWLAAIVIVFLVLAICEWWNKEDAP